MLNKLEKKLGKYAISNLTVYLLMGYALGYLFTFGSNFTNTDFIGMITLEPYMIIHHFQIWRLFTWILIPPGTSVFWAIFMFLMYYQLGTVLERKWGSFRYNVYIFGGMLFTIIGAFISYGICCLYNVPTLSLGMAFSTYYINLSIFLAFATYLQDVQVRLYFLIPIKMKWMAIVYVVILGIEIVQYLFSGAIFYAVPIISSLLNFVIFYFSTKGSNRYNPKEIHRKAEFRRGTTTQSNMRVSKPISRHRCVVCGRTELTNPDLEFRFCSRCNGNYEYCSDHLFTHTHAN